MQAQCSPTRARFSLGGKKKRDARDERGARYVAQAFMQDTMRAGWIRWLRVTSLDCMLDVKQGIQDRGDTFE